MDLINSLTQGMEGYSQSTLNWVNTIVSNATMAVGLYLVGIFLVFDIVKLFEKANSSNGGIVTLRMFQGLAFRASLGGMMVGLSSHILNFILMIGVGFAKLISKSAGGAFDVFNFPDIKMSTDMLSIIGDILGALTNPTDAIKKVIMTLILLIIGALVTIIAFVMVWVILMLRFFQLYVMLALMPIPMASFASEEHSQIGKTYLKKVLAYSFQPAVIMIVFGVYHFLSKITLDLTGLGNSFDVGADVAFYKNLILAIVFIIALWQTHKKSSELFGV